MFPSEQRLRMCQKLTGLAEEVAIAKMTIADLVKGTKRSEGIVVGFSSPSPSSQVPPWDSVSPLGKRVPVGKAWVPAGEMKCCKRYPWPPDGVRVDSPPGGPLGRVAPGG